MADPKLAAVIKSIESSGNQHAIRFEPDAYQNWAWVPAMDRIKDKHKCSIHTAKMLACTSWGFYQLMGVNLFDPRIAQTYDPADVFAFVNDVGMQDAIFHAFLGLHGIDYNLDDMLADEDKLRNFARVYNGPGQIDEYVAKIKAAAQAFSEAPQSGT